MIYLYIKQHASTGLKYFGKTTRRDPFKYRGSGTRWIYHCRKHGLDQIKTVEIWGFDDQSLCTEFALKFSKENDIVSSDEWANLTEENGYSGGAVRPTFRHSKETKAKIGLALKGKKQTPAHIALARKNRSYHVLSDAARKKIGDAHRGKIVSEETKQKMRGKRPQISGENNHRYGKDVSLETRRKISESKIGKSYPIRVCPHCEAVGAGPNMTRFHFDNCSKG